MITFRKKWISIVALMVAFVVCSTFGVIFSLDTKNVLAETTYEYETYDVLYTDEFSIYDYAKKTEVENNGSWTISTANFLDFTPSAENTTGSFIWNFKYTATNVKDALNVYPLASGNWGAVKAFDFNNLPDGLTAGQTYDVEFGVLKIKNSENYYVYVKLDGQLKYSDATYTPQHNSNINQCIANGCSGEDFTKHTGIYFNGAGTGTCVSARPETTVDRLTNSDWTNVTDSATLPTEWSTTTGDGKYLTFAPSEGNTTSSFIWNFDYLSTATGSGVNVYPFAGEYNAEPPEIPIIDTLSDLGGTFTGNDINLPKWGSRYGTLIDPMKGTIVFKASGISGTADGSLYVSLFQDGTVNAGEASDGIYFYLCTDGSVYSPISGVGKIQANSGYSISSTETYMFTVGYNVPSDYSKLTVSVKVEDSAGNVITNGSKDVTTFSPKSDALKTTTTVKDWLTTHTNKAIERRFR